MSVIIIILLSFLIASAWLHYLRKIDLFETENLIYVIITFILGAAIPSVIHPLHRYVFDPLYIYENGRYAHDFIYYVFGVGAVEEPLKFVPALIALFFMKKAINEPLDYIKYTLVSALGFAFTENIDYCLNYGVNVLISRSILAVPAHMFFSALFVYGVVLFKYKKTKYGIWIIPFYMLLSFVAHGIYDFSLAIENGPLGILITVIYFFILMSLFVTILNNALNNSPFFNPKHVIDTDKLTAQVSVFYVFIIGLTIAAKCYFFTPKEGMLLFFQFALTRLFILVVLVIRLCRFKLIQNRWNRLKLELPFAIYARFDRGNDSGIPFRIRIKGDGINDVYINHFFQQECLLSPVSQSHSVLKFPHKAYIENKIFLKNDETFFVVKVTIDERAQTYGHFLLKAKSIGLTRNFKNEPIAALLTLKDPANKHATQTDLKFLEWVVLKKLKPS